MIVRSRPEKKIFLLIIKLVAVVKKEAVCAFLRTSLTLSLPLVTANHIEVRTIAGESPAVVESPVKLNVFLFEIDKEHFEITAVTMQIMQMDYVGLNLVEFRYKLFGQSFRVKTIVTEDS